MFFRQQTFLFLSVGVEQVNSPPKVAWTWLLQKYAGALINCFKIDNRVNILKIYELIVGMLSMLCLL